MARRFLLTNRPGADLHYAVEAANYNDSVILEIDTDGHIIGHIPVLPDTEYMYKPDPDPEYNRPQKIVTAEGEVEIPVMVPEGKIAVGENPFIQIIYRYVKRTGVATEMDIIRHIMTEKRYLPKDRYGIKRIQKYIAQMCVARTPREMEQGFGVLGGLLIKTSGGYGVGLPLQTGRHLLDIYTGYDPFEYQMARYIENKGVVSRDELHRLMLDRLKLARKGSTVEYYIRKLLQEKCMIVIAANWFEYKKFPELIK
jgi:hypothetical protein